MAAYSRTLEQLKAKAVRFWPDVLREQVAEASILPLLLRTQDKFISVLNLSDADPEAWRRFVDQSPDMAANLFLKHLMVLSDLGRETMSKLIPLSKFFDDNIMRYTWREQNHTYRFQTLHDKVTFSNSALGIEPKQLVRGIHLTHRMGDLIMLLLHSGASFGNALPEGYKAKCQVGTLIGDSDALQRFVKENYLRVSTQIRGQTSNALGQLAQNYVKSVLKQTLPEDWIVRGGSVPGISHNDGRTDTTFDIVVESPAPSHLYFAVEIGFQETTNSVIERKAGQAQARRDLLHAQGAYIAYVVDGVGNVDFREPACRIICNFSDCTVAFSVEEIRYLAQFMRETAAAQKRSD